MKFAQVYRLRERIVLFTTAWRILWVDVSTDQAARARPAMDIPQNFARHQPRDEGVHDFALSLGLGSVHFVPHTTLPRQISLAAAKEVRASGQLPSFLPPHRKSLKHSSLSRFLR